VRSLTFLLAARQVLQEVNRHLIVARQIDADVHSQEIVDLAF